MNKKCIPIGKAYEKYMQDYFQSDEYNSYDREEERFFQILKKSMPPHLIPILYYYRDAHFALSASIGDNSFLGGVIAALEDPEQFNEEN